MELDQLPRRRVWSSAEAQATEAQATTADAVPELPTPPASSCQRPVAKGFVDIYEALSPRQISVIAIGSAIGTGLMVATGRTLSLSGPAAMTISFSVVGFSVYLVLSALGEVAAWLPKPYTVADQADRFCDPALGFSLAWIYWLKYAVVTPNQLTAAALLISYWLDAERINPGIWITGFLVIIVTINYLHHRLPSRVEFYVSSFKLVLMFGLMILSLVIALGGGPDQDRRGFRYWKYAGAFGDDDGHRLVDKLLLTCATMSSATFAYIGSERSGLMPQTTDVRKAISRAIRNTFYRIMVFHLLGITLLGMIVPHDSISLAFHHKPVRGTAASPFVAALDLAEMEVLPDILNAFLLLFVLSIANYDLYLATKAMCDLSLKHRAPAFLSYVNQRGVPVYALGTCACLATLAYLNVYQDSTMVFGYFVNTVTMLGLLTWMSVLITHISFVRARKAQGIPDDALVFRARFGLPGTCFALTLCLFIAATMIVNSLPSESSEWQFDYKSLAASYIGIPLYMCLYIGYKTTVKSRRISPGEVDLWGDKQVPPPRPE